jgi:hypothetical protein
MSSAPLPPGCLADAELAPEVQRLHRLIAQATARAAEVVAEAHRRGLPLAAGYGSTTAWLTAVTGDSLRVCSSRVRVALALRHMAHTREAFAEGRLAECRVRLLVDARNASPQHFERDETLLVNQACSLSARVFPLAVSHWRRLADPQGALDAADQAFARRRLHISPAWAGMVRLDGDLDPEGGAVVLTAIRSLAEPPALEPGDGRSPQQRRADALVEICRRHLDSSDRPRQGGERPHLIISLTAADLAGGGLVDLETGAITAEAVRRLGCDARLTWVALDARGRPSRAAEGGRIVSPALRRALALRDQYCTHPGCDVPARWCDAHHIRHWGHGGQTVAANLRLLCRRHHRLAHDHSPYPRRE